MSGSLARAAARLRRPALGAIGDTITRHPFKSALAITTGKTVAADLLVQFAIERREWEARRTALFAAFGLIYQGAVQYLFVNIMIERLFPGHSLRAVLAKCGMMNGFCDPCFFLPTFYVFKEAIRSTQLPDVNTVRAKARALLEPLGASRANRPSGRLRQVRRALMKYRSNCIEDIRNTWLVWVPGHLVTYGLLPPQFRLPWMSVLSFGYVGLLSVTRGRIGQQDEEAERKIKGLKKKRRSVGQG